MLPAILRVEAKARDIRRARQHPPCPQVRALDRALVGTPWRCFTVVPGAIAIEHAETAEFEVFAAPKCVAEFVVDYDIGRPVAPHCYELPIPKALSCAS